MYYIELCNKEIGHQVRLGARSDWETWNLVPVSIDGNGNAIIIFRFSNLNVYTLFITSQIFFKN